MIYYKYNIEKLQVSYDRGVTWEDVVGDDTRRVGRLIRTYTSLDACNDEDCDLEKYEYTFEEKPFPASLCGPLPEGIADTINWISGAICQTSWRWAVPTIYNSYVDQTTKVLIGHSICGDGYCPSFAYFTGVSIDGREIVSTTSYGLTACYTVTKFMPWCEGKTTWRTITAQKYVRDTCHSEWVIDGEPEDWGIGERWHLVECTYYRDVYQHQILVPDDEGDLSWEDEGEPIIIQYQQSLPSGVELIDGIPLSGNVYSPQWYNASSFYMELKIDQDQVSVGGYMYKIIPRDTYLNLDGMMGAVDSNNYKTYLRPCHFDRTGGNYTKYSSLFCDIYTANGAFVDGSGGYGTIAGRLFEAYESKYKEYLVNKNITTSRENIYFPARKLVNGSYHYGYVGRGDTTPTFSDLTH